MILTDKIHLITDGKIEELHEFAKSIDLKRCWFENHKFKHYNIKGEKVKLALEKGAKLVTARDIVQVLTMGLKYCPAYKKEFKSSPLNPIWCVVSGKCNYCSNYKDKSCEGCIQNMEEEHENKESYQNFMKINKETKEKFLKGV